MKSCVRVQVPAFTPFVLSSFSFCILIFWPFIELLRGSYPIPFLQSTISLAPKLYIEPFLQRKGRDRLYHEYPSPCYMLRVPETSYDYGTGPLEARRQVRGVPGTGDSYIPKLFPQGYYCQHQGSSSTTHRFPKENPTLPVSLKSKNFNQPSGSTFLFCIPYTAGVSNWAGQPRYAAPG